MLVSEETMAIVLRRRRCCHHHLHDRRLQRQYKLYHLLACFPWLPQRPGRRSPFFPHSLQPLSLTDPPTDRTSAHPIAGRPSVHHRPIALRSLGRSPTQTGVSDAGGRGRGRGKEASDAASIHSREITATIHARAPVRNKCQLAQKLSKISRKLRSWRRRCREEEERHLDRHTDRGRQGVPPWPPDQKRTGSWRQP